VTPPVIAWTMVTFGWRTAFMVSGAVALVVAVLWYVFTPVKDASGSGTAGTQRQAPPLGEQLRASVALLGDRRLMLLCSSYAMQSAVFFAFVFWFFRYLTDERGFSMLKGGVFGAVPYLVAAVVGPCGGLLLDRLSQRMTPRTGRRAVAMGGLLMAAACVALGAMAQNPYLAITALSLSVGCLNAVENPFWVTATDLGAAQAGAAGGVLNFMGNMGGVVSIWAVPRMVTAWGWTPTLATWAGVAVVGALLWLTFTPERPTAA
jgi:ACS family glucarate transporter-like MFS transporter